MMGKEDGSGGETGPQDTPGQDVPSDVPAKDSKDSNADVYDNRGPKKIIRVVTVMAYLFSVSFVGILLSAYYIFLWEPPNARLVGRLRADPQVQFLMAAAQSANSNPEIPDLNQGNTGDADLFLESEPNRSNSDSFRIHGRMTEDDDPDIDSQHQGNRGEIRETEQQRRLSAMLHKLRQSLVQAARAQNEKLSRQVARSDDSFIKVKRVFNAFNENDSKTTKNKKKTDYAGRSVSAPTQSFTDSINALKTLNVENTSPASKSATIPGTKSKTKQNHFARESVSDADRETVNPKQLSSSKLAHTFREESTKRDEAVDDRQLITGKKKENPSDDGSNVRPIRTITTIASRLEENRIGNGIANLPMSTNVDSRKLNYSSNKSPSNIDRSKRVTRNHISMENAEFEHEASNYPIVIKASLYTRRNMQETQIEKMTARSTTMDNKHPEEMDLSTTERQRGLWEMLAETADMEETSVKLTSISTTRNYRNNLTSTANDDDESVA